ncbi:Pycsar system effector family protein [Paracoccus fistulariae]|uniref:Pycsar effector protein domain-containing protein n=1 Tax=Paracoccus fistulariae TaxID=658446 RepID=A0ABY7SIT2_9RHOB|nr:Pycsar system effector family protein [Paracoccus fistulariae]MDB6183140.1 DUF5706 domain-containing protein [Paracoccus fistulariae]WCR06820.1 hypothetical protein JHX87_15305 [Paracoccus fistulariae]
MSKKTSKKEKADPVSGDEAGAAADSARVAAASDPKPAKEKAPGSSKAVETMFRSAIRAELEIIALAATKANIMISLNGLIISALMISGAFIFASTAAFLLPAGVFLITAAASIFFALLAASPERAGLFTGLRDWAAAMWHGKARLRDLRGYLRRKEVSPDDPDLNVLIYEHRVALTRDQHWQRMQELLRDREEIYHRMTDQLYWLGVMADRKFRMLDLSYTIFRWGLLASVLVFISVKSVVGLFPSLSGAQVTRLHNLGISEFTDIYEPSAVQQLADGRVLVVEDEASRAMSVMSIAEDGSLIENARDDVRITRAFGRKLNDLEGLSIDDSGNVYTITSHSLNKSGDRRPDREQLLRFQISGNSVGNIRSYLGLRDAIATDEALKADILAQSGEEPDFETLNIEGLSYYKEAGHLLLGLREPMAAGRSVVLIMVNPDEVFEHDGAPRFAKPILLDLRGGGIRALSYDPILRSFLIVNEIEGYEGNRYSQLWSWSGDAEDAPEPVALPDIINLNNVESIDSITIQGEPRLLLMSDEGNEKKNRPARYMMLEYDQIEG